MAARQARACRLATRARAWQDRRRSGFRSRARRLGRDGGMRDPLHRSVQHEGTRAPETGVVGVLTVDDDAAFRRLVRDVIGATAGFRIVGEAACGEEGVSMAAALRPDLVLMDVRMPGSTGSRRRAGSRPTRTAAPPSCSCPPTPTCSRRRRSPAGRSACCVRNGWARGPCGRSGTRGPPGGAPDAAGGRAPRHMLRILAFCAANSSSVRMPWSFSVASCLSCAIGSGSGAAAGGGSS